jgi:hypothetical protein
MAISRMTMVDDDGTGTTGTVLNNAWLQSIYNAIDAADAAIVPPATTVTWTAVPFSAANHTSNVGTWVVEAADQINYAYARLNANTVIITFDFRGTTVTGSPQFLYLKMPGGLAGRNTSQTAIACTNAGAPITGSVYVQPGSPNLYVMLANIGAWSASTNLTNVMGTVFVDTLSALEREAGLLPVEPAPLDLSDPRWAPQTPGGLILERPVPGALKSGG